MRINNRNINQRALSLRNIFVSILGDTSLSFENTAGMSSYEKHFAFSSSANSQCAKSSGKDHIVRIAFNEASDKSIWLGYTEKWRIENSNANFIGSIQRYYYCPRTSTLATTKADEFQLAFRIECEARETHGTSRIGYARPHFHCHLMDSQAHIVLLKMELEQPGSNLQQAIDFDPSALSQSRLDLLQHERNTMSWVSHIHFPLIADWLPGANNLERAEHPCFVPDTLPHLDGWITSSVNYFISQLTTYLG